MRLRLDRDPPKAARLAPEATSGGGCGRAHAGPELRCGCGSLLARKVEGGVEVKCRRCKRTIVLPVVDG